MLELIEVLRARVRVHVEEIAVRREWPLYLHRQYAREEILAAVGYWSMDRAPSHREGVLWLREAGVELLFVTIEKTERQYSPTTRYEDYAVSPRLFHWQSQSTTSEGSATGRRYTTGGAQFLLFVRARPREA